VFEVMQAIVDERYFKNTLVISPGVVGSVGDVLNSVRLRQSAPDMMLRYDQVFSGRNEPRSGSNVQDGYSYSYTSGGGPSRTLDSNWTNKKFKTAHGWIYQDLRVPDKTLTEIMGSTGRYDWYNRVANTYQAKITGDMFLPLPGGYQPSGVPRGGQVPRIIARDEPQGVDLTDDTWYDKRKKKEDASTSLLGTVVVCTDPQTGKMTYKTVPGKTGGSEKAPPATTATQTTAAAAPTATNATNNTKQPEINLDDVKWM
jgi:hypothetical protein